jgi:wyosine [tRNA(Phe)-imidazoG37] synthetase (radical SAM superfamily)
MPKTYKYIFGPVPSRRFGLSLGIDLLGSKICSMDCIYCEVGKTRTLTLERKEYVPSEDVLAELKDFLSSNAERPDYITFSGMGEPTLHSKLGYIIDSIHNFTDIPVCVLTNSTTIVMEDVFNELLKADVVVPSLDALIESTIKSLNKPVKGLNFQKIVEKLKEFKKKFKGRLLIEILFVKGINDNENELKVLNEAVNIICPDGLQIHTVARPSMSGKAEPVSEEFLEKARSCFNVSSPKITDFNRINKNSYRTETELVTSLLRIRSCHFKEILDSTGIPEDKLKKLLNELNDTGMVKKVTFNDLVYFKITGGK